MNNNGDFNIGLFIGFFLGFFIGNTEWGLQTYNLLISIFK